MKGKRRVDVQASGTGRWEVCEDEKGKGAKQRAKRKLKEVRENSPATGVEVSALSPLPAFICRGHEF